MITETEHSFTGKYNTVPQLCSTFESDHLMQIESLRQHGSDFSATKFILMHLFYFL